ncbi:MAG: hypothetical protein Q7S96_02005 [bacterium]|nr:hypothetical protein [bacterium]
MYMMLAVVLMLAACGIGTQQAANHNASGEVMPGTITVNTGEQTQVCMSEEEFDEALHTASCGETPALLVDAETPARITDPGGVFTAFRLLLRAGCEDAHVSSMSVGLFVARAPTFFGAQVFSAPLAGTFDYPDGLMWTGSGEALRCNGPGIVGDGSLVVCTPFRSGVEHEHFLPVPIGETVAIEFNVVMQSFVEPGVYRLMLHDIEVGTGTGEPFVFRNVLGPEIVISGIE